MAKKLFSLKGFLYEHHTKNGVFVSLKLYSEKKQLLDENLYWLPGTDGNYTALQQMKKTALHVDVLKINDTKLRVTVSNSAGNPVSFFNRIALIDAKNGNRILPSFFSDNYLSILPGETKSIDIDFTAKDSSIKKQVQLYGWNMDEQLIDIK
jgi:mannosylglycoprotein endo-beta-mannosidase